MRKERIRNLVVTYFTCTRSERNASWILIAAILSLQAWREFRTGQHPSGPGLSEAVLETAYQSAAFNNPNPKHPAKVYRKWEELKTALQPFDPNSLDAHAFVDLGLSERQAESLIRYRELRGGFRSKEDVRKVRVLDSALFARWSPFISLPEYSPRASTGRPHGSVPSRAQRTLVIDLNRADTNDLMDLPLIGSGRARAIYRYRERLGGFHDLSQLNEIRALPDSVISAILPFVGIATPIYRKLQINHAPVDSLVHPYCPKPLARMVVAYREQHGLYNGLTDLSVLPLSDAEILRKLAPYLSFDSH
jgi:competence protein ComEA